MSRWKKMWMAAGILGCLVVSAAEPEVLVSNNFDTAADAARWQDGEKYFQPGEGRNGSGCVKFAFSGQDQAAMLTRHVDPALVRGRAVVLAGWMKAENLGQPKVSYLGSKLMIVFNYGENVSDNADQSPKKLGSYDWTRFEVYCRIPASAKAVALHIGLQNAPGTVWFDDVTLTRLPEPKVSALASTRNQPLQKTTRFRGVMSGDDLSPAAFRELGEVWGANLMRFQFLGFRGDNSTPEGFREIVRRNRERLDRAIPLARKYGIRLLIDMHAHPGEGGRPLGWKPETQQLLADVWRELAAAYKDEPVIWGYDILNEPYETNYAPSVAGSLDWNGWAEKIARAIREVDPKTPIIVESAGAGNVLGFEYLRPIDVPGVIYSFHFYNPQVYTHQNVGGSTQALDYPGVIQGKMHDRAALEKIMLPAIEFQKKYNVPIFVGEFSAVRWAPGAEQYLADCIAIFEKYGWDWTYHAYREWEGWDAEIGSDKANQARVGDTPRRRVLLDAMKQNRP